MIIFGKDERAKFEAERNDYSQQVQKIYDEAKTYRDFTSLSENVTRYFDFEAYGQYLDDNGRFVETDHGIYELP